MNLSELITALTELAAKHGGQLPVESVEGETFMNAEYNEDEYPCIVLESDNLREE